MPSTSTKKEMAVSDVLYALSTICDGAMMRMKVLHEAYGKSHDEAAKECQKREYKTIYGNKFFCLSELAAKVADILENNGGRMHQVSYLAEYESLIMLVDHLVDTGALQLNCVRLSGHPIKMNGRI